MSDKSLSDLVDQVTAKAVGPKPPTARYVGLEHIEPSSRRLAGHAPASVSDSTNGVFDRADILFGKLRPNLRKSVQVGFGGFCSTDLIVMRAKAGVDPGFAAHVASSEAIFRHAEMNSIGTGMPRTSWRAVAKAPCWVPPLEEQRRITEVLDTIDETIEATERVIAKSEVVRSGLMQALVAVASDWPRQSIGGLLARVVDNRGRTPPYTKSGVPAISAEDVGGGTIKSTTKWVTPDVYRHWTRGVPSPGDVLVTTEAPVGEVAQLPDGGPCLLTRRVVALGPDRSRLLPDYLYWYLRHFKMAGRWGSLSHGTTVPRLLKPDLLAIRIGVVDVADQKLIVGPLNALADRLAAERDALRKLHATRAGLAADLLSGRIRTAAA